MSFRSRFLSFSLWTQDNICADAGRRDVRRSHAALKLMSGQLTPILLALAVTAALAQPLVADHTCSVSDAYDLSHGLASAGGCSTLELQNSITFTSISFSVPSLTVNSLNLTIQPSKTASDVVLNFGSYTLNRKVLVTLPLGT